MSDKDVLDELLSVWFGWATLPDLIGTRQECEEYVSRKMLQNQEYARRLTIQLYRTIDATEQPS